MKGDLVSPRVGISEGAHFRGSVDMNKKLQAVRSGRGRVFTRPRSRPTFHTGRTRRQQRQSHTEPPGGVRG